jgi:hypothetical protein
MLQQHSDKDDAVPTIAEEEEEEEEDAEVDEDDASAKARADGDDAGCTDSTDGGESNYIQTLPKQHTSPAARRRRWRF